MLRLDPFERLGRRSPSSPVGPGHGIGISLRWHSAEASHVDSRVLPCPVRDEASRTLLARLEAQDTEPLPRAFRAGELLPDWDAEQLVGIPGSLFPRTRGHLQIEPGSGRFYPGSLLAGAPELTPGPPTAFRVTSVAPDGTITLDFNHPLAGRPVELDLRLLDLVPPGAPTGNIGRAAVTNGPGMQARWRGQPTDFHSDGPYERPDSRPDAEFYFEPRMVQHVDDTARAQIRALYAALVPRNGHVLDLMSSWTSHLDPGTHPGEVAGLGMNAEELAANPKLSERVVQDLNLDPRLPWPDCRFDAVICTVSVEYLTRPVSVFREVRRVLRPGGRFVLTFSNRWFPPKAIALWPELHEFERMGLVLEFFLAARGFENLETWSLRGLPRPASDPYAARFAFSDPVYAVWGEAA
ncbi:MAG TPA: methyltransferase domain-containing protein [Thioalkalivibrio sp.]|nr:methyltransferase domain-containing protein [Thioalkalivibrio sp.]